MKPPAKAFQLLSSAELEALPDLEWLVEGILPKPALAVMYGEPGCGKTFVCLSMALAAAAGHDWLGRRTAATDVLYIAAEGVLGLRSRVAAYAKARGPVSDRIQFMPAAPNIRKQEDLDALTEPLDDCAFRHGLIVVDTLARVSTGADENSAKDMGEVVAALDALKSAFDATVLVIHHSTKNGGSERGSSVVKGAADVMIKCATADLGSGARVTLECEKMKEDEPFKKITAELTRVRLHGGKSSLVLSGEVEPTNFAEKLAGEQIVKLLTERFAETGATNKELLDAFIAAEHGSKSKFDRVMRELRKAGKIRLEGKGKGARYYPVGVSVS